MKILQSLWDAFIKANPIIFFVIVLAISLAWSHWIYEWIWGGAYYVSSATFLGDIIARSRGVPKEELLWRCLPFTAVTVIVLGTKDSIKRLRILILVLATVFIGIVQIQFGLKHICTDPIVRALRGISETPSCTEQITFVVYQGVLGMFYAVIYLKTLLHMKGRWRYFQLFPLLVASLLHIMVNGTMVLLGLYGY